MSRNPEYQFVSTDPEELVAELIKSYEDITGMAVHPASPEKLFIVWMASFILRERVAHNHTANQNIPSRAEGAHLDALAGLYHAPERPGATAAVTTMRFYISAAQEYAVLIPAGTRVSDRQRVLIWETMEDVYIPIGSNYAETLVRCQTSGAVGNGYAAGQITRLVDLYDYCNFCTNLTESAGGSDAAGDEEYYELLVASMDAWSCAGPQGAYEYFARQVSTQIADVVANSPAPGYVDLYALMDDGTIATAEIKNAMVSACDPGNVRAMGDLVSAKDPETVGYDIELTYYLRSGTGESAEALEEKAAQAVSDYVSWQSGKFGRDINPDELRRRLYEAGVKRIELVSPAYRSLSGGLDGSVPQVAQVGNVNAVSGGFEDE